MNHEERLAHHCIEHRVIGKSYFHSVSEWEDDIDRGEHTSMRGREFWGLTWTEDAPGVEELTTEWQPFGEVYEARICDWDLYDAQMQELIGLS